MRRLRILTWHIHGSYLYNLTKVPHDFYVPFNPDRTAGYTGRQGHMPWGDNLHEVPVEELHRLPLDCVVYQWREHYLKDRFRWLSKEQLRLPTIYLEHDPPQDHPTFTRHMIDDPNVLLVHVTPFNALMWDSGRTPTCVIEHGVYPRRKLRYQGDLEKGLVVINHLQQRGRRLGADIFEEVRHHVPIDLVGMRAEDIGGLGEILHGDLPAFQTRYRFFFNPIRYTSLGLAVIEAMMGGLPIIGLATTEMVTVIENGVSGFLDTNVEPLIEHMKRLLRHPAEARRLGEGARRLAQKRFNIHRFIRDWNRAFARVTETEAVPC